VSYLIFLSVYFLNIYWATTQLRGLVYQPFTTEARVQCHASPNETTGVQSGTGTSISPTTSIFPCQYHSTDAPYSFITFSLTLYNVRN